MRTVIYATMMVLTFLALASVLHLAQMGFASSPAQVTSVVTSYTTSTTVSTSVVQTTVTSAETSATTIFTIPRSGGIPGFPIEAIIAGIAAGLGALFVLRKRRN